MDRTRCSDQVTPSRNGKGPGVRKIPQIGKARSTVDASKTWIVMGRHDAAKKERAKQFRQEMTLAEKALWQQLRTNKLDGLHFRRQQVINGLIADFYCHEADLVVEADGDVHDDHADADAERDRILTARGLRVLRFTNTQVMDDLPGCLDAIRAACRPAYPPAPPEAGRGDSTELPWPAP